MKVLVTMKVEALDSPIAGLEFKMQKAVMETESSVSELGIIDRLTVNWVHMTPYESGKESE